MKAIPPWASWSLGRFRFLTLTIVSIYVIWKISFTISEFWIFPSSEALLGDLQDRYREFHFFVKGLDPKLQDSLLGYPAWSYLMAGLWAWPKSFHLAKLLFFSIQLAAVLLVGLSLKSRLRLTVQEMILIGLASVPIYVLLDLLSWGIYGIVEATAFYFSIIASTSVVRVWGLVGAILKPQTGLAAWIAALLRRDWSVICASGIVVIMLMAIASKILGESSIVSFLLTMKGGFDGRLDHFYSTGNYGFLSNAVQAELISPAYAVGICYLLFTGSLAIAFRYVNDSLARYVFAAALFPLFTYHRTHDLILVWPALIITVASSFRLNCRRGWFWVAPIAWSQTFRENQPLPALLFLAIVLIWWNWLKPACRSSS